MTNPLLLPVPMTSAVPQVASSDRSVLATDLDGTLIPLEGNDQNCRDLRRIGDHFLAGHGQLVYVSGRHFESVQQAIKQHDLPLPHWIICDVGTSVYQRESVAEFRIVDAYQQRLAQIMGGIGMDDVQSRLATVSSLTLQESFKQGPFKLSYYSDADRLQSTVDEVRSRVADLPLELIASIDPFNNDGLLDVLPAGVSKAYALRWWADLGTLGMDQIAFAGDSGNDLAALTAGFAAIVVGNAAPSLVDAVRQAHQQAAWTNRLFVAPSVATSGVLEGCRYFGILKSN